MVREFPLFSPIFERNLSISPNRGSERGYENERFSLIDDEDDGDDDEWQENGREGERKENENSQLGGNKGTVRRKEGRWVREKGERGKGDKESMMLFDEEGSIDRKDLVHPDSDCIYLSSSANVDSTNNDNSNSNNNSDNSNNNNNNNNDNNNDNNNNINNNNNNNNKNNHDDSNSSNNNIDNNTNIVNTNQIDDEGDDYDEVWIDNSHQQQHCKDEENKKAMIERNNDVNKKDDGSNGSDDDDDEREFSNISSSSVRYDSFLHYAARFGNIALTEVLLVRCRCSSSIV